MALSSFFSARLLRLTDLITRLQGGEGGIKGEGFEKQREEREKEKRKKYICAERCTAARHFVRASTTGTEGNVHVGGEAFGCADSCELVI